VHDPAENDDDDSDEDIEESEIQEEMDNTMATLNDKKPSLRHPLDKAHLDQVLAHAQGYAASVNRPNRVRGSHRALVHYIHIDPKFAKARAENGVA